MADTSEEKTEEASQQKLNRIRKEGQIPIFQDFSVGLSFLTGAAVLVFMVDGMVAELQTLFTHVGTALVQGNLEDWLLPVLFESLRVWLFYFGILAGVLALQLVVGKIVQNKGMIFSAKPITPKLSHINPIAGFKRVFGKRAIIEFVKTVAKVAVLGAVFYFVLAPQLQSLVHLASCGMGCLFDVLWYFIVLLVFLIAAVTLIIGVLDMPMQLGLFMHEQKMTKTEQKQEYKDNEGKPEIKQERNRLRQEDAQAEPVKRGIEHATLVIFHDANTVGLRFVEGQNRPPVIVAMGTRGAGAELAQMALMIGKPFHINADLAGTLLASGRVGEPIPQGLYRDVAIAMSKARDLKI